jgi:uncharacterized protein involved in high-affinity Fe2+ transport
MFTTDRRGALRLAAPLAFAGALAGCGAASGTATTADSGSTGTTGTGSTASTAANSGGMSGMDMGATPAATSSAAAASEAAAAGVKPVPTQVLGTADWQGMKITASAMTPVPFLIYNGTTMQEVKPAADVSFHLMVDLDDAQTNVAIPYASVWGTIKAGGKTPFDESLWPMISRYMGPHYGNDVALPGAGSYQLTLLISPPVSARHLEYEDVWLKPHTVNFTFHWDPVS